MGWEALGEKYLLDPRQVRNIWADRPQFALSDSDPFDEVLGILESLAVAAEDFNEVAQTTKNESNRIGAIRHRVDTQLRRFELMRQFGLVPEGQSEAHLRGALEVVLAVLSRVSLSDQDRQELSSALSAIDPGQGPWIRRAIPPALVSVAGAETSAKPDAASAATDPTTVRRIR